MRSTLIVMSMVVGFVLGVLYASFVVSEAHAAPERVGGAKRGLSAANVEYAKKHWNGQGQIQDRLEVVEKMLGLRPLDD